MLEIRDLEAVAGDFRLKGISFAAPGGSYGVLLGPPGSGKSVLVETICGLRAPSRGQVFIGGRDVTDLAPRERRVGYVPQDYVLFPTKRVADNIVFGLRSRGWGRADALKQVEPVVNLLGIRHLLGRWPATLSGGEQQRVALARALAIEPRVLLLDEPVSALDEGLRERVCRDLRRFQRQLRITTVHISHNLEEALAVSDWAAVLDHGRLQQVGPMAELLRRPRNEMVARFLRSENIVRAHAEATTNGHTILRFGPHAIRIPGDRQGQVTFVVRPEALRVADPGAGGSNTIAARLVDVADRGVFQRLEFDLGLPLVVFASGSDSARLVPGNTYPVHFPPEGVHVLDE